MAKNQTILTHMSFKGGSSKTCLNLNFIQQFCFNYPDKKVLFIDADPQSNASVFLLGEDVIQSDVYTIKDGLEKNLSIDKLILKAPLDTYKNLDIIASSIDMVTLELILNTKTGKEYTLLNYLTQDENIDTLSEYDLIVFDLNPAISVLNTNVFICCTDIIPIINYGCYSTLTGYDLLIKTYGDIKKALRLDKDDIRKPVITKFEKQENNKIKMWLECADEKGIIGNTFKQTMRKSVHYENSILYNEPISEYVKVKDRKIKTDIGDEMTNLINEYIKEDLIYI
ncbi:sporulation initiation inhibitor,Sporulation initiation inhibitor protein soj,plasmid partitioning protein RepA,CobQ/CobB/MinD/ParA nucleotide binding domain [[Clostridium] sordellii]|uniref:ParA family protein n=1 Tax=Paraclostridium sordellii TaxID=1505 RepID=UPI000543DFE7|nr:ParA family protein [Paeniclostridium sordellii]CEK34566.1 sporulation initiation inhibitor,Sporulation initiation inhibitor protein soj,plasmid partitioning protein RepA,CobQ/CobB/MinD/ParA nucleotide binding domain [[Clostridium] sordellii] [Paeniclostridium sordellii]